VSEKSQLIDKLKTRNNSRQAYTRAKLSVNIPSQIRALRRKREMTQGMLAHESDMKQSRISAMERPGTVTFNIETLIRLAAAFKVGLIVKFAPFSEMLNWENSFSQDSFDVSAIDQDSEFIYGRSRVRRRRPGRNLHSSLLSDDSLQHGSTTLAPVVARSGAEVLSVFSQSYIGPRTIQLPIKRQTPSGNPINAWENQLRMAAGGKT
jgi:transcriptional regulator with XRE-family HTH domain